MAKTLCATIEIEAPLLTKSSVPGEAGLDSVMARNADNHAVLHDSHVKGRLREAWRELTAELNIPVNDWLGTPGGNRQNSAGAFSSNVGQIQFKDFVGPEIPENAPRVRVQIDADRRAASEHMLQMIESPFPSGQRLTFKGAIECEDTVDPVLASRAIKAGLYWASTFGAMRTSGFGRILTVEIEAPKASRAVVAPKVANDRFWVWLKTSDPVCVTESRAMENLFVSGQVLPGSVIKGAVASTWLRALGRQGIAEPGCDPSRPELSEHFAAIRFSHARLANEESRMVRQVVPPLSIGWTGDSYHDFATAESVESNHVAFQPDWKDDDFAAIGRRFGAVDSTGELRVRTAIDSQKRRAAESQLFAWQVTIPKPTQGWMVCIDCGAIPHGVRDLAKSQLASVISSGIRYVGKTKATMSVEIVEKAPEAKVKSQNHDDLYILTLQTPALLGNPDILTEAHSREALFGAYAGDFSTISDRSLTLVRFFARQRLEGGTFLQKRFLDGSPNPYQPFFVTFPGSVFVLKVSPGGDSQAAAGYVREWERHGLPPAPWCRDRYRRGAADGDHWSNHPYLRESGFGEIAVNLCCHWEDPLMIPPVEIPVEEGHDHE